MDLERGWPGRIDGDRIVQLAAQTLQAFFTGGGGAREHASTRSPSATCGRPVLYPPAIRLFAPFERGATPFFSFVSPHPVLGPEEELRIPAGTEELDYRVGVTAVIGAGGEIGGFTLANVWTARDLARAEREAGHGPAKSGDFGISLGPLVVTPGRARRRVGRRPGERRGADARRLPLARPSVAGARRACGAQHGASPGRPARRAAPPKAAGQPLRPGTSSSSRARDRRAAEPRRVSGYAILRCPEPSAFIT